MDSGKMSTDSRDEHRSIFHAHHPCDPWSKSPAQLVDSELHPRQMGRVASGAVDEFAQEYFIAEGTFTGEVDGAAGSFDFVFVGEIDAEGFAEGRGTAERRPLSGSPHQE